MASSNRGKSMILLSSNASGFIPSLLVRELDRPTPESNSWLDKREDGALSDYIESKLLRQEGWGGRFTEDCYPVM